ncbi:hypothetical protein HBB16_03240 [Pseudonocardia sp. MCCB 268]|nr:hypothetical protein [Pseudonocardia cytotoxica]
MTVDAAGGATGPDGAARSLRCCSPPASSTAWWDFARRRRCPAAGAADPGARSPGRLCAVPVRPRPNARARRHVGAVASTVRPHWARKRSTWRARIA